MPYNCTAPYPKGTSDAKLRIRSCSKDENGVYTNLQPCVEECWVDNTHSPPPERPPTESTTPKPKPYKPKASKPKASKPKAKASKRKASKPKPKRSKRKPVKKKSVSPCQGKEMSRCMRISGCKYASGPKRSFCRKK